MSTSRRSFNLVVGARFLFVSFCMLLFYSGWAQTAPIITSFSPISAKPGDAVTLTGTDFNATASNNIVFFGATRATVTAASATSLTVTVPVGATYAPITLLNTSTSLACASLKSFNPVFDPPKSSITASSFADKVDFTTGSEPFGVAAADLDGDGKTDLAVVNYYSSTVSIFRSTASSGSLTSASFAPKVDFSTGGYPKSVSIGDLDGDGKLDLVVVNSEVYGTSTAGSISVLHNTSSVGSITNSSFSSKIDFGTSSNPMHCAIGDLDGDGKPDLVVANYNRDAVSVFRNTTSIGSISNSSFASKVDYITGSTPLRVAIEDLDTDGKLDLAVLCGNGFSLLRNNSTIGQLTTNSFSGKIDFSVGVGYRPTELAIGDLDNDGKPDLALAVGERDNGGYGQMPIPGYISIFRNTATSGSVSSASFAPRVDLTGIPSPYAIAIGDVDGDGKPDVVTSNVALGWSSGSANTNTYNTVAVLRNTANSGSLMSSSFSSGVQFTTANTPSSLIVADLDGDGKSDLAVANRFSNTISLLRNADPIPEPPYIATFSPVSAGPGDEVILTGTEFNSTPVNNVVYFGATRATVSAATASSIRVTVPVGATYSPITILNSSTSLSSSSPKPFIPVFTPQKSGISTTDISSKVDFPTVNQPRYFTVNDIDGDGKADLIVPNFNNSTFSVLRNTTTSGAITSSSFAGNVEFVTGTNPFGIASGDLDGDGMSDIVVTNYSSNTISIMRNISSNGVISSSSFDSKVDFTVGSNPTSVAIGDFDGDGKPDIAVANFNSNTVSVLRNTSTGGAFSIGTFSSKVDFTVGSNPTSVAIGDFDGDGKPDIAVANFNSNTVSILRNTAVRGTISNSSFAARVDIITGSQPYSLAVGDLDIDGKIDIAVCNFGDANISVIKNISTSGAIVSGSFSSRVNFTTGTQPRSIAIGDLDGDGKPDLTVSNFGSASLSVLRNTTTSGSFNGSSLSSKVDFTTGASPWGVGICDLDGDGKSDLVAANFGASSTSISILRNSDPPCSNPTTGGTISAIQTGASPFDPAAFTSTAPASGETGTIEYKWQSSTTSSSAGFSDIATSNSAIYDPGALTQTTWFKRMARVSCKSDWTDAVESNVLEVTVHSSFSWNGSAGTDWSTAANWTPNFVPSTGAAITIPTGLPNYPVTPASVTMTALNLASGNFGMGTSVITLTGALTNNGTISGTGKLVMGGSTAQAISGSGTISNLEINNAAGVTITSGAGNMLTLTGKLTPTLGTLTTNGNLTLRSDINGTARVGQGSASGGYISGDVVTQRYLSKLTGTGRNGRAWRLVTIPVTGTGTLRDVFMAGQSGTDLTVSGNRSAQPADLGTVVIGHNQPDAATANGAGYDWIGVAGQVSSLRYYQQNVTSGSFASSQVPTLSTSYTAANQGYMLFARGDRQQTYNGTGNSSATVLQATGALKQGTVNVTIPALASAGFVLVGNPYMAVLDLEKVILDNAGVIENTVYVWDANIDGNAFKQGGYRAVTRTGVNTWSATGGSTGANPQYIESGSAFFVKPTATGGTLSIKEAHKVDGTPGIAPHSSMTDGPSRLFINLEVTDTANRRLVDGAVAFFDTNYKDDLGDAVDIEPMTNLTAGSVTLRHAQARLSMEGRAWPADSMARTIPVDMRNLGDDAYVLRILPTNINMEGFTAWLKDRHHNKETSVKMDDETLYPFRRTGDPGIDSSRFEIVYRLSKPTNTGTITPDGATGEMAPRLYPNPAKGVEVKLSLGSLTSGRYEVQVLDISGRLVLKKSIEHVSSAVAYSIFEKGKPAAGHYTILLIDQKNQYKETLRLVIE